MEGLEYICFEIISNVGMARSTYIEAMDFANEEQFTKAEEKLAEGDQYYISGHRAHAQLIQKEATGKPVEMMLLLVHAEDQLMSAETFRILAEKFIILNKKVANIIEKGS